MFPSRLTARPGVSCVCVATRMELLWFQQRSVVSWEAYRVIGKARSSSHIHKKQTCCSLQTQSDYGAHIWSYDLTAVALKLSRWRWRIIQKQKGAHLDDPWEAKLERSSPLKSYRTNVLSLVCDINRDVIMLLLVANRLRFRISILGKW